MMLPTILPSKNCKDILNRKFGKLTVVSFSHKDKHAKCRWNCRCECGNTKVILAASLLNGRTKSCGCEIFGKPGARLKKNLTGLVFGKLTVLGFSHRGRGGAIIYACRCECGSIKNAQYSNLVTGKTRKCGNCGKIYRRFFVNGRLVSSTQRQIKEMLGRGVLNFKTVGNNCVDVAVVQSGIKIAIEYDGWYWHKNRLQRDAKKVRSLMDHGWKVISIKGNGKIPSKKELEKAIMYACISVCTFWYVIELDDWGK